MDKAANRRFEGYHKRLSAAWKNRLWWQNFERTLNAGHLRAFLKRLPDFDDMEAEEKALAYVYHYPDVHRALAFLLSWPALDQAARLAISRAAELDGDRYEFLTSAAEALRDKHAWHQSSRCAQ
ncbi:DUF6880 family protein [Phyllobacterium zundukense]|uniref:Uncharacterized protein n=1 Tax=Phyllobacterium zundukense TaxID=1867719 RepID=A0ACD4CXV5_9HYPH|nr:DUF6880 family protein [Phyllobacterium zundukense]UXN58406.1 hypothetical protein N8E88_10165 [Phyllobacterium zundukense]